MSSIHPPPKEVHQNYVPDQGRREKKWKEVEALVEQGLLSNGPTGSESLKVRTLGVLHF